MGFFAGEKKANERTEEMGPYRVPYFCSDTPQSTKHGEKWWIFAKFMFWNASPTGGVGIRTHGNFILGNLMYRIWYISCHGIYLHFRELCVFFIHRPWKGVPLFINLFLHKYYSSRPIENHLLKQQIDVSKNRCTPKSSILIGFSILNHPFWGTLIFRNTQISHQ